MGRKSQEQYRRAASVLGNAVRERRFRSVLIAGPHGREGATTVALHAAMHLREHYRVRPLVVEANLARPVFAKLFKLDEALGIHEIAAGKREALDCIQEGPGGIGLLAAGRPLKIDIEMCPLATVICRVLQDTEEKFPAVLIDCPPVLRDPDILSLASVVPRMILVVKAGRTRFEVVERAKRELTAGVEGFAMVGGVLNEHKRYIPGWLYRMLFR